MLNDFIVIIKNVALKLFLPPPPFMHLFLHTHTHTRSLSRARLQSARPPSRPPPWAAGAQGFPRVSDWSLDCSSLITTVITECHLSMLFPLRKTGSWTKQKPAGTPVASSARSSYLHQYYSPSSGSSGQIEGARGLCSNSNSFRLLWIWQHLLVPVRSLCRNFRLKCFLFNLLDLVDAVKCLMLSSSGDLL